MLARAWLQRYYSRLFFLASDIQSVVSNSRRHPIHRLLCGRGSGVSRWWGSSRAPLPDLLVLPQVVLGDLRV
jgi:hypothetical protein